MPILALAAGFVSNANAQSLDLSGDLRVRAESIEGQARVGFNESDSLVTTRLRLRASYDAGLVRAVGELYDSRAFFYDDGAPVGTNEVNAAELVQAYVAADFETWGAPVSVQAGRFTLNLGSRRLVAADDYRNTTNGYTGVLLSLGENNAANATFIFVAPQVRLPDDPEGIDDQDVRWDRESDALLLFGGVATAPVPGGNVQASYFGLREDDTVAVPTRDRALDTFGLRAFRPPARGRLDYDAEVFVQTGAISASVAANAAELDVAAWFAHAEIGRSFDTDRQARLAFMIDYASGDEPGGDYERFDTLFGMRRAELAPAGLYNAVGRANMISPGVRVDVRPTGRSEAFVALRGLWLASDTDAFSTTGVRDLTGNAGDFAGLQLDARFRHWLVPERVRLEANFVYLDRGRFLREAPNVTSAEDTLYAALDISFTF